jgi:hypothetical protein
MALGAHLLPLAVADDQMLYHVLHPTRSECDEWTQNYGRALAYFYRFSRDYGCAHLHVETHHARQYDANCLLRTDDGAAA